MNNEKRTNKFTWFKLMFKTRHVWQSKSEILGKHIIDFLKWNEQFKHNKHWICIENEIRETLIHENKTLINHQKYNKLKKTKLKKAIITSAFCCVECYELFHRFATENEGIYSFIAKIAKKTTEIALDRNDGISLYATLNIFKHNWKLLAIPALREKWFYTMGTQVIKKFMFEKCTFALLNLLMSDTQAKIYVMTAITNHYTNNKLFLHSTEQEWFYIIEIYREKLYGKTEQTITDTDILSFIFTYLSIEGTYANNDISEYLINHFASCTAELVKFMIFKIACLLYKKLGKICIMTKPIFVGVLELNYILSPHIMTGTALREKSMFKQQDMFFFIDALPFFIFYKCDAIFYNVVNEFTNVLLLRELYFNIASLNIFTSSIIEFILNYKFLEELVELYTMDQTFQSKGKLFIKKIVDATINIILNANKSNACTTYNVLLKWNKLISSLHSSFNRQFCYKGLFKYSEICFLDLYAHILTFDEKQADLYKVFVNNLSRLFARIDEGLICEKYKIFIFIITDKYLDFNFCPFNPLLIDKITMFYAKYHYIPSSVHKFFYFLQKYPFDQLLFTKLLSNLQVDPIAPLSLDICLNMIRKCDVNLDLKFLKLCIEKIASKKCKKSKLLHSIMIKMMLNGCSDNNYLNGLSYSSSSFNTESTRSCMAENEVHADDSTNSTDKNLVNEISHNSTINIDSDITVICSSSILDKTETLNYARKETKGASVKKLRNATCLDYFAENDYKVQFVQHHNECISGNKVKDLPQKKKISNRLDDQIFFQNGDTNIHKTKHTLEIHTHKNFNSNIDPINNNLKKNYRILDIDKYVPFEGISVTTSLKNIIKAIQHNVKVKNGTFNTVKQSKTKQIIYFMKNNLDACIVNSEIKDYSQNCDINMTAKENDIRAFNISKIRYDQNQLDDTTTVDNTSNCEIIEICENDYTVNKTTKINNIINEPINEVSVNTVVNIILDPKTIRENNMLPTRRKEKILVDAFTTNNIYALVLSAKNHLSTNKLTKNRFFDYNSYYTYFTPLIANEILSNIEKGRNEKRHSESMLLKYIRAEKKSYIDAIHFSFESLKLCENDAIKIIDTNDKSNAEILGIIKVINFYSKTLIVLISNEKYNLTKYGEYRYTFIASLSTSIKEYMALCALQNHENINDLINPTYTQNISIDEKLEKVIIEHFDINKFQAGAVVHCVKTTEKFSLIQGPPGTGKTTTIITLISVFFSGLFNFKKLGGKSRILICAASNSAIDEVARRIINNGLHLLNSSRFMPNLLRVGIYNNISQDIKCITFDYIFEKNQIKSSYAREAIRMKMLTECDIVFSTLSSSAQDYLFAMKMNFDLIIVDEACQCVETSTIIPYNHLHEKMILIGDPMQLPPITLSPSRLYIVSLFERLSNFLPKYMLSIQYRMNSIIATFPNICFYNGKLLTDDSCNNRNSPFQKKFAPIMFVDITGNEICNKFYGYSNEKELREIFNLIFTLYNKKVLKFDNNVAIITPYKAQAQAMLTMLRNMIKIKKIDSNLLKHIVINTVDAFQGQEKDLVIISAVRTKNIGFINDTNRMNVMLTRAKFSVVVFGKRRFLSRDNLWAEFLNFYRKNNAIYSEKEFSKLLENYSK